MPRNIANHRPSSVERHLFISQRPEHARRRHPASSPCLTTPTFSCIRNNFNTILYVPYRDDAVAGADEEQVHRVSSSSYTAWRSGSTSHVTVESVFGEKTRIVNRNFPGGQADLATFAAVGTTALVVLNLRGDRLFSSSEAASACSSSQASSTSRPSVRLPPPSHPPRFLTRVLGVVTLWASGALLRNFSAVLGAHLSS
ncbi:hypothetical protein FA95DRAFT_1612460 [Auriscalpium vulgare]|uniref:Uncharacterized protein n=1 Tax=Auriscalpium vulgare TaxID=40419 RepID=A0ACB8R6F9_9AGAM|nr:hypothetical protein FA95DRAFT_1612460 [Auriscalpium vulgare]